MCKVTDKTKSTALHERAMDVRSAFINAMFTKSMNHLHQYFKEPHWVIKRSTSKKRGGQEINCTKRASIMLAETAQWKKSALWSQMAAVWPRRGDVSPDCAILRGFLAKEKSEWHPLEHKDGKRECRPHQNEKSKVLAMKNPTGATKDPTPK